MHKTRKIENRVWLNIVDIVGGNRGSENVQQDRKKGRRTNKIGDSQRAEVASRETIMLKHSL